jgi:hypothetical protein
MKFFLSFFFSYNPRGSQSVSIGLIRFVGENFDKTAATQLHLLLPHQHVRRFIDRKSMSVERVSNTTRAI